MVHMHAARRLHWDLRLEMDGVLRSWAVPKGPSPNRADKRLAVHVEDHPLEYGDFEGLIPEGNYGAGAVIVWDRGRWVPLEDPEEGMKKGKLLFELRGYKLRGKWTLVKLKKGEKEWLLIKEKDAYVSADSELPPESVLSGLTVEELKTGKDRAAPVLKALARLKAPRRAVTVAEAEPMLAETREQPFSKPGWLFELKLDGYRVRAAREESEARLLTRKGNDIAAAFPELGRALAALPFEGFIFDAELVVPDEAGRPSFQRLQNRVRVSRGLEVRRGAVEAPAVLYVFDLLAFEGYDLRPLPLEQRKALLEQVVPRVGPLKYLSHFEKDGEALYEQVVKMGLEGIVAKKADAPYRAGRSPNWLKIRADRTDDFIVVGFTRPKGSRSGFGALDLGAYQDGKLVYAGRAGSGFTDAELKDVTATLERGIRETPAFTGPVPPDAGHTWVEPTLIAEVRYKEWTDEGLLRQPVFVRFRDDKPVSEIAKKGAGSGERDLEEPPAITPGESGVAHPEIKLSNLDKVFWPDEGYTKGDLIEYYRAISPWMLPYLTERPLVLTRFPDGINGKSFFQKDAPEYAQAFVRTITIWSEDSQRELDYFVCDNESCGDAGGARLVHPGPRSEGCSLYGRRHGREGGEGAVRRHRPADEHQDERLNRPARADSVGPPVHVRAIAHPRGAAGAGHRGRAARDRHGHPTGPKAGRQGVPRLRPERPRATAGGTVQRAAPAGRARVHAAEMDRGDAQARHQEVHDQDRSRPNEKARRRSAARGARAQARFGPRARAAA